MVRRFDGFDFAYPVHTLHVYILHSYTMNYFLFIGDVEDRGDSCLQKINMDFTVECRLTHPGRFRLGSFACAACLTLEENDSVL